jgi:hypothetical protein
MTPDASSVWTAIVTTISGKTTPSVNGSTGSDSTEVIGMVAPGC